MDPISIELDESLTVRALRQIAQNLGKRLVISFEVEKSPTRAAGPATAQRTEPAGRATRRKRRKLSPEARAALAKNLEKARAAQAAKRKAAAKATSRSAPAR